jgi:FKBP-type peptidyl-prolyl cis-trans isomerase (trigger factor)
MTKTTEPKTPKVAKKADKKVDEKAQPKIVADNATFTLTIAPEKLNAARQGALTVAQQQMKLEGFRKGMAPLKLVEQSLSPEKLRDLMMERTLPQAYQEHLRANNLVSLTEPDVKIVELSDEKGWQFEVSIALPPKVELGEYQEIVKKLTKTHDLWKKAEEKTAETDEKAENQKRQAKLQAILQTLLESIVVAVPELLLRRETERQLHDLSHQLEHWKLTLEQYLKQIGKSQDDLQQDTAVRALMNLQIDFLLGAIVGQEKLSITAEEVQKALPEDKKNSPEYQQYVASVLLKQKAVDFLLTIAG